jgi:hypothetical protein
VPEKKRPPLSMPSSAFSTTEQETPNPKRNSDDNGGKTQGFTPPTGSTPTEHRSRAVAEDSPDANAAGQGTRRRLDFEDHASPVNINRSLEGDDDAEKGDDEGLEHCMGYRAREELRKQFPHIKSHPDPLVESASLASVPLPDPDASGIKQALIDDVEKVV